MGAEQEAGQPRPPSLSSTAPTSPECSALEPESKGGDHSQGSSRTDLPPPCPEPELPAPPGPLPLGLSSPQGPTFIMANAFPFLVAFSQ